LFNAVEKFNGIFLQLEAFGNCRTPFNTNATRFTHIFSLDFDHSGQIAAASIQLLIYERQRVTRWPTGQPTFHVFYEMIAGATGQLRRHLQLDNISEPCSFMNPLQTVPFLFRVSIVNSTLIDQFILNRLTKSKKWL
jgi:myosin-18